jgi:hypothetical protein
MLSVRSAAKCALSFVHCSPLLPFSLPRVNAANALFGFRTLPEPVSRCGLSLARNDAFTPFRGQCSRPAPSIPRRTPSRIRSISDSLTPFGFEADPGRYHRPTPVSRADFRRSRVFHPPPLPFGHFRPLRIKAFSEHPTREARLTGLRSPFAPLCDFFRFRSGSTLPVRCVPLD